MVTPTLPSTGPSTPQVDAPVKVLARVLRQKREEAEALVRLVEQATPPSGKGQHVNYYA
jgi:hypothetical protein